MRRHTRRVERPGRDTLRETATTKSRVVQKVSVRRLPARRADSSRRTRAASGGSGGSHDSARAYIQSCAVHRQIRLARRPLAVASRAHFTRLQYIYIVNCKINWITIQEYSYMHYVHHAFHWVVQHITVNPWFEKYIFSLNKYKFKLIYCHLIKLLYAFKICIIKNIKFNDHIQLTLNKLKISNFQFVFSFVIKIYSKLYKIKRTHLFRVVVFFLFAVSIRTKMQLFYVDLRGFSWLSTLRGYNLEFSCNVIDT